MQVDPIIPNVPLVLASGSRYRAEQLASLGFDFTREAADIDETPHPAETADALAARLAADKARAVCARHPGAVIIGSDQVAMLDGAQLGKPGDAARARVQLERASGRAIDFLSAVHVLDTRSGRERSALVPTRVRVRSLSGGEIARYVARERPLDCAGAFKVESLGIALFERIDSEDPTALVGLPLIATARLLRACGYTLP